MTTWLRRWWNNSHTATSRKQTQRTRMNLEAMEAREVPAALTNGIALASYNGAVDSTVNLYDPATSAQLSPTITPFAGYRGPVVAAAGDVNHDGRADVIVGAQAPNGHVEVFDGATGALQQSFLAFPGFNGAVNVGSADVNGDGYADILVSATATNAHVKAFSGLDGSPLASFFAFPGFLGDVSVSGADFNGDGAAEIIVGAGGVGANGRVALFNANGSAFSAGAFAFPGFNGAISVAGGDVNGDGISDVVVGGGPTSPGGPVIVYSGAGFMPIAAFMPYSPTVTNGTDVFVADGNRDGVGDIFAALHGGGLANTGGLVPLSAFDGRTGLPLARGGGGDGTYSGVDNVANGDILGAGYNYTPPIIDTTTYTTPDTSYTGDVYTGSSDSSSSGSDSSYYDSGDSGDYDYGGDSGYYGGDSGYSGGDTSYSGGDTGSSGSDFTDPDF